MDDAAILSSMFHLGIPDGNMLIVRSERNTSKMITVKAHIGENIAQEVGWDKDIELVLMVAITRHLKA